MTIENLIDTIHINPANVERIALTGKIDGRFRSEIRRVMIEWAERETEREIKELSNKVKIIY